MNAPTVRFPAGAPPGPWTLPVVVVVVAAAAWLLLALTGHQVTGTHGPGHTADHDHTSSGALLLPVAGGWVLMVLAMMLPPALPLLDLVRRLGNGLRPGWLVTVAAATFVAIWTAAGTALALGTAALRAVLEGTGWSTQHPQAVLGAGLLVAGGYQFAPLKDACLRACRSPRSFAVAHWHGRRPPWAETAVLTAAYSVSCVGCCWALMAVGLLVGAAALPAMAGLAVLMAAERLWRHGRRLVRPAGLVAVIAGAALLLDVTRLA